MFSSKTAFYIDQTTSPLLASYVYFPFNFAAQVILMSNDDTGSNQIVISFDGITKHGQINPGETMTIDNVDASGIFLRYGVGAPNYRMMARPQ